MASVDEELERLKKLQSTKPTQREIAEKVFSRTPTEVLKSAPRLPRAQDQTKTGKLTPRKKLAEDTSRERISYLTDPNRKLSYAEKRQAQRIANSLSNDLRGKFFQLRRTPEDVQKKADISALEAKYKTGSQFGYGLIKAFGGEALNKNAQKVLSNNEAVSGALPQVGNNYQAAQTQNPIANLAGGVVGEGLKYATSAKALGAIPKVGQALQSGNPVKRVAAASAVDLPMDIASSALYSGGDKGQFAKELGLNVGLGLGAGAAIEGIGTAARAVKNANIKLPEIRRPQLPFAKNATKAEAGNLPKANEPMLSNLKEKIESISKDTPANLSKQSTSYMQQVDAVIRGTANPRSQIVVGDTPSVLTKFGANQHKLTLDYSDVRKIAYPDGYMGGKHNLGFYALEQLPNQLENPVAIMKSSTQNKSLVVFTELLDSQDRPVMVPIHLDKNGRIGVSNDIASMYGRKDFEKFIEQQKNKGNILYEDKNRSLQSLPASGLQLSRVEAKADPIFNSTIPQKADSVNSQPAPKAHNYENVQQSSEFGGNTVGSAQHNPNSYSSMQNEYGTIPPGENPARIVDVPKKTTQGKTRRFTRTMMESEAIPESMIGDFEKEIVNGTFAYAPMSDKSALSFAEKTVTNKGFNGALTDWEAVSNGSKTAKKNDIALGEMLLNQAANAGDTKLAMKLAAELAAEGTRAGQNVQALRMLKKMTPDGQLYYLQKTVQNLNSDLLEKLKLKAPNVQIDESLANELLSAQSKQEIDVAVDKITQNIADQIPSTWEDKWNAWRYLAMLGNPRTHVRNLVGNGVFTPAVKLKNLIATPLESKLPIAERTKSVLTKRDKALKDFAREDFSQTKDAITAGGKLNPTDLIKEKQRIFKNPILEAARKFNLNAMEAEDAFFLKQHYTASFAQAMKARSLTPEFLKNGSKEAKQALENIRNYSIQEAQKATFRDASSLANALNKFKKSGPVQSIVGEGLFPFTKTPVNILKRGAEYSPIGLVNGLKSSLFDVRNGTKSASQAIDEIASGLSGTAIVGVGAWLSSMGLITGGGPEDDKESLFDKLQGNQNYALRIGDKTYTLDWAAPASLPLFVGVETYNMLQGEDAGTSLATFLDNLTKIGEPMVNMSMLKGLNDMFKAVAFGENPATDAFAELASGYFGQSVPTVFGQVARTIDDTRRTNYVDKNSGIPPFMQKFAQKQQAKLPFASKKMNPYVDAWGREQKNGSLAERAFQNFLSPGYVSSTRTTEIDTELQRLYESTGEKSVLPSGADRYIRFDNETKSFTASEYYKYATEKGRSSFKNLEDLVNSKEYANMTDSKKAETVSLIYGYANALAKTKVSNYKLDESMQKAKDAEGKGIKPSEYFVAYAAQKDIEGDRDGNGNTISGTEKIKKRDAIDAVTKGMSFDKKDILYKSLGAGLSEAAEKKWSVQSVQSAVGSKEKYYKIQELISTIQADKDEYGNSVSGTARPKEVAAISKSLGVSSQQADKIYNELVTFKHSIPEMSSAEQDDWKQFKSLGMNEAKYIKYTNEMRVTQGLKDAKGKTISGSLKQNRYKKLLQLGLSSAQARHFLSVRYNYKW